MQLTKHFTVEELTRSTAARNLSIDNTPNKSEMANLKLLAETVLEPLREAFGHPIIVNSGFLPLTRRWAAFVRHSTCLARPLISALSAIRLRTIRLSSRQLLHLSVLAR